ncbi:MAG: stalk domain-containing protein [Pseudomonadota bacterium]
MKKSLRILVLFAVVMAALVCNANAEAGSVPYNDASSWAVPELERASTYGFITERMKERMNAPITREEFSELAVVLYEKYTGVKAVAADMNVFADTVNPEIFKAYNLKIVKGTDTSQRLFSPDDFANREQVAVMLYRTIKAMDPGADFSTYEAGGFMDEADISGWAVEALEFMNLNGFMKDEGGRIGPKGSCTREMAVLITTRIYEKYFAERIADSDEAAGENKAAEDEGFYLEQIVMNDVEILADNYRIRNKDGIDYILISTDKFKYAFKLPDAGYYTYPDVNVIGGSVSIEWKNDSGTVIHADMQEGSEEAVVNGTKVFVGIAPFSQSGKMFIPINFFISERGMNSKESIENNTLYIQYEKCFPAAELTGNWSDSDIDLFARTEAIKAGATGDISYGTGYLFRADGTYGMRMVSTGGGNGIFILQEGEYRIMGNTILCHDILETVYSGSPLVQQYKDKKLDKPQYMFIYNYEKKAGRIEIGGFWLNRL